LKQDPFCSNVQASGTKEKYLMKDASGQYIPGKLDGPKLWKLYGTMEADIQKLAGFHNDYIKNTPVGCSHCSLSD
jgi:hypothetical protein